MDQIKSMTAFGRAEKSLASGRLSCELQSLNRRFLDCQISLPPTLLSLDPLIRRHLSKHLSRGQIVCQVRLDLEESSTLEVNRGALNAIEKSWEQINRHLGEERAMPTDYLLSFKESLFQANQESVGEEIILEVLDHALAQLLEMKQKEGEALAKEILFQLQTFRECLKKIQERIPHVVTAYKNRLKERVAELGSEEDERILKEIAIYAERIDIREELVRLESHVDIMEEWVHETRQPKGKMGEFIIQELSRETNTIGAKAADTDITSHHLTMKGIIEKLREQVQNIE